MITIPVKKFVDNVVYFYLLCSLILPTLATISATNVTNENYVALILARGGSKSIVHKNLAVIENKSLLKRTIEIALHSRVFSSVWVSTDYLNIYEEANRAGARVFGRGAEAASDTASSFEAVKEFSEYFTNITVIALLQCTSPFQSVFALRKAYRMMQTFKYDSIFSVTRSYKLRWKRSLSDDWKPINFDTKRRPRRQDMKEEFVENGMFYWFRTELLQKEILQGGRTGAIIIPPERSSEIDSPEDLTYARILSKNLLPTLENEKYQCSAEEN